MHSPPSLNEQFRVARASEIPQLAELIRHSFPGAGRTAEWWTQRLRAPVYGGGAETVWLAEMGGDIVAACQLHPLRQWIAGDLFEVMGLGSVAISPACRRRGLATRLVHSGLRHAREGGDVASALYPFRIGFYERLGYGLSGVVHQYLLPPEAFPAAEDGPRVTLVSSSDHRAEIRRLYAEWAPSQSGQLERPDALWRDLWEQPDHGAVIARNAEGGAEGYALVRYRTDLPLPERFLEVEERAWLTPAANRTLVAWLSTLGDQWPRIAYRAHPQERFGEQIAEPRLPHAAAPGWRLWFPAATVMRGPMFRLLDVGRSFEKRRLQPGPPLVVECAVADDQFPENTRTWRWALGGGRAEAETAAAAPPDLRLGMKISTLSRIFTGDFSVAAAVETGAATADSPEHLPALDALLRVPSPWTFDRF